MDDTRKTSAIRITTAEETKVVRAAFRGTRWDHYQLSIKMFGKEETDRSFSKNGGIPTDPSASNE